MANRHLVFISDLGHTGPIWPQILDGVASQGWRVTILSPKLSIAQKRFFHLNYSSKKWTLIETKEFSSPYRRYAGYPRVIRRIFQIGTPVKPLNQTLEHDYLDGYAKWKDLALVKLNKIFETDPFELIVSSSSPFITHIVAKEFKARKKVKWIADYRDMWSLNHNSKVFDKNKIEMERNILATATACSTTSEGFKEALSRVFNGPIVTIHNGYDTLYSQKIYHKRKYIQILYPGQIYEDFQDIRPLLNSLHVINRAGKDFRFKLLVSGYAITHVKNIAIEIGLSDAVWLKFGKILPLAKSLKLQRKADLLLLLNITNPNVHGVMQTKLYEYIASGVPIIAVGGTGLDESSALITTSRTGFILKNESEINDFFNNFTPQNFVAPNRDISVIQSLSRNQQGIKFTKFIESLEQSL